MTGRNAYNGSHGGPPRDGRKAVVIDTNVLIDAMVGWLDRAEQKRHEQFYRAQNLPFPKRHSFAGPHDRRALFLLEQCFERHRVCFTRETMQEFVQIALDLKQRTRMPPTEAMRRIDFINHVEARMTTVEPAPSSLRCRDPKDQMFLAAAQGCHARYLISRDADLLSLGGEGRCEIVHPGRMVHLFEQRLADEFEQARRKGKPLQTGGKPSANFKQHGSQRKKPAKPHVPPLGPKQRPA